MSTAWPGWGEPPSATEVGRRLEILRARLAGAGGEAVRIVAVTKGFGPGAVAAAVANGLLDVGENYAQELLAKAAAVPPGGGAAAVPPGGGAAAVPPGGGAAAVRWHYLGAVQRRQVPRLAPIVTLWHGVTRAEEGAAIAATTPGATVLVEVELTGQPGRRGVAPGEVGGLVSALTDAGVVPVGLMAMGVQGDLAATAMVFRRAAALAGDLGLPELSMGMSDDVEVAVAEGATMVRVGRALFGDRPPRFHPHPPSPN